MKVTSLLAIAALCVAALFTACGNDANTAQGNAAETAAAPIDAASPATPAEPFGDLAPAADQTKPVEPPQNAAGVWHYTCPKGCEGGAGSAIACPKCGTTLVHNTAYHPPAPTPTTTTATGSPTPAPGQTPVTMPAPKAEPPQNAAGVWHYTCPDGCAGGGGAATPCAKCSKTLVHNTAYHNK